MDSCASGLQPVVDICRNRTLQFRLRANQRHPGLHTSHIYSRQVTQLAMNMVELVAGLSLSLAGTLSAFHYSAAARTRTRVSINGITAGLITHVVASDSVT